MKDKFGLYLTDSETQLFFQKIGIENIEHSLSFISLFMEKFIHIIPFQNFMMLRRGFGVIPSETDIKKDMLSLKGGTCATINTFVGALLYKIGFNTSLINGTMQQENDHVAILLSTEEGKYTIDLGDGQPYFLPHSTKKDVIIKHPFRTYKVTNHKNHQLLEFLINGKWCKDVILNIQAKHFTEIYTTIEKHYTKAQFGPFWKGFRYTIYPNKQIISFRDNLITQQHNNIISKTKIQNYDALLELMTHLSIPHKEDILLCYKKLELL